jgi:retron-type reverse transcriptase
MNFINFTALTNVMIIDHNFMNELISRKKFCASDTKINIEKIKKNNFFQQKVSKKIVYSDVYDIDTLKLGILKIKKSLYRFNFNSQDRSTEILKKLRKELKTQTYQPRPIHKRDVTKFDGGTGYVVVSSYVDMVVQAALVELLTPIVEFIFYNNSYGFRPNRGCHDALKYIKYNWQNIT